MRAKQQIVDMIESQRSYDREAVVIEKAKAEVLVDIRDILNNILESLRQIDYSVRER